MKVRIYQLARDLRISSDALVNMITALGADVKGHMSSVDDDIVAKIKAKIAPRSATSSARRMSARPRSRWRSRRQDKEEAARRRPAAAVTPPTTVAPEPVLQPSPPRSGRAAVGRDAGHGARARARPAGAGGFRPAAPPVIRQRPQGFAASGRRGAPPSTTSWSGRTSAGPWRPRRGSPQAPRRRRGRGRPGPRRPRNRRRSRSPSS